MISFSVDELSTWRTKVRVYNNSPYETAIYIRLEKDGSTDYERHSIKIEPYETITFRPPLYKEYHAIFIAADTTYVDVFMDNNAGGYQALLPHKIQALKDTIKIASPSEYSSVAVDLPWISFEGRRACHYLKRNYWKILDLIALKIYLHFPERMDRQLIVGDATPLAGSCPGHEKGTHKNGSSIDLNYYTYICNTTKFARNGQQTPIWDSNGNLMKNAFDGERCGILWASLAKAIPGIKIIVSSKIYNYMSGLYKANDWWHVIEKAENRDCHQHIVFSDIDWDVII